jgi:sporulation protein YlmC with PRC-barrel domain
VDVNDGQTLGEVADLIFDPGTCSLAGLLVAARGQRAPLLEVARRTFGGTMGLTYVGIDHVLSLNADVVTIELGDKRTGPPHGPLPRLSAILQFDVITLQGRRLGHLVDLLLDPEGRRIVGYLVAPPAAIMEIASTPVGSSPTVPGDLAATDSAEPATTPTIPVAPASPPLIVVASDQGVRVGRDLIIVAGASSGSQARPENEAQHSQPFAPRPPAQPEGNHTGDDATGHEVGRAMSDTGWPVYDPDAPTEQIRT